MATGRFFVGTSGFAYKEWVGPFYPPGTKSSAMLGHYATAFNSVEVNYTFRRSPTVPMMEGWSKATDEGFVFALKANQGITHFARLKNTGERLGTFLEAVAPLGARLGPVLFQCPPNMKYDPEVLDGFLADLAATPGEHRFVMEFRHPSFDTDEVREKLAAAGVALLRVRHGGAAGEVRPHRRLRLRAPAGDGLRREDPRRVGGVVPLSPGRGNRRVLLPQARRERLRPEGRRHPQADGESVNALTMLLGARRSA